MEEVMKNGKYEGIVCIYKIENKFTGKVYIGSTNNLRRRINSHIWNLTNSTHDNKQLQNSWNAASSKDNFFFEIIEEVEDESFLPIAELYHIEKYKRINGVYNVNNPLDEVRVIMNREKRLKSSKQKEKSESPNKSIQTAIKSEFEYMLVKLKEKINDSRYVEFSKIIEYVIKNISLKDLNDKDIENNLIRVLRKSYNLSVFNFESPSYSDDILHKHGINARKRSVINKDMGKLILEDRNAGF